MCRAGAGVAAGALSTGTGAGGGQTLPGVHLPFKVTLTPAWHSADPFPMLRGGKSVSQTKNPGHWPLGGGQSLAKPVLAVAGKHLLGRDTSMPRPGCPATGGGGGFHQLSPVTLSCLVHAALRCVTLQVVMGKPGFLCWETNSTYGLWVPTR